jgi:hypothetical protein
MKSSVILILFCLLILSSCDNNTAPERYNDFSHYLSGVLECGSYIERDNPIRIGITKGITEATWDTLPVSEAEVRLQEIFGGEIVQEIYLMWDAIARGYVDEYQQMLIAESRIYRIEVNLPDGSFLTAETVVPASINVYADSLVCEDSAFSDFPEDDEWLQLPLSSANAEHPLQIGTQNNDEFNLYVEIYCLEEFWEAEYTYPEDIAYPKTTEEYMGDSRQYPRRNMSYYMYQPQNFIVSYNSYQSAILFYGRTEISVYSIDSNLLNYLYKIDGFTAGGIDGGIGIFGSRSGKKLYTQVIR